MSKAVILTIGDELLIGQTVDTNSAWMGEKLSSLGIDIIEKIAELNTRLFCLIYAWFSITLVSFFLLDFGLCFHSSHWYRPQLLFGWVVTLTRDL